MESPKSVISDPDDENRIPEQEQEIIEKQKLYAVQSQANETNGIMPTPLSQ